MQTTPCCLVFVCVSEVSNSLSPIKKKEWKVEWKDLNPGLSGDSPERYPLDHNELNQFIVV